MTSSWKHSLIAVLVCLAGAAPSFLWSQSFNLTARLTGIALFVAVYAILPHTGLFARAWSKRRVRRALQIGYTVRVAISILFPVGMIVDLIPGMISASITGLDAAGNSATFWRVFATTVVQGLLLHGILAAFVGVVYAMLSAGGMRDEEPIGRAFEVIPLAKPAPPK